MNYKFLYFIVLFCCSSVFGMSKLSELSIAESANLWRGGVLTTIRRIEIKHEHKLVISPYFVDAPLEFDKTGKYLRLNCVCSEKNIKYHVIYEIANQEINNKKIIFLPAHDKLPMQYGWFMENGALMKRDHEMFDYEEELICDVFKGFEKHVVFGCFQQNYQSQQNSNSNILGKETDIGAYDFRYDFLLFRLPINRTRNCNLAVNHNSSMIATNLDDGKDTVVILYPQCLTFLNYKNYYDFNIIYK